MSFTRRDFGKIALAAVPAASLLAAKPDSKWGGVQVGINAPYSFQRMSGTADKIIEYMTQLNLSACELRLQPVEAYFNAPGVYASANDAPGAGAARGGGAGRGGSGRGGGGGGRGGSGGGLAAFGARGGSGRGGGGRAPQTPEQQAAAAEALKALTNWRLALSQDKMKEFRKKYEDAGILIQILKVDNIGQFTDDMIDYAFTCAKNLGANAISTEGRMSEAQRLGTFADKHKMMIGYHGHTDVNSDEAFGSPQSWEKAMSFAKYNGINLDLGHFVAGNSMSPVPFLTKYHDRVTHVHVKDKKMHDGPNTPFGQGDTPIVEVLQLMKKNKWKFEATIEYEYTTPPDSTVLTEIGKCVEYCRKALV
jgi:sugar phosphate isomerase/epimerase